MVIHRSFERVKERRCPNRHPCGTHQQRAGQQQRQRLAQLCKLETKLPKITYSPNFDRYLYLYQNRNLSYHSRIQEFLA